MTEKRFKSLNCGLQGQYIKDNGTVLTIEEVVNLLNELNDENKQLRFDFKEMKDLLHSLEDENKTLKQTNQRLKDNIDELLSVDVAEDLLKENKELKEFKKQVTDEIQDRYDLSYKLKKMEEEYL